MLLYVVLISSLMLKSARGLGLRTEPSDQKNVDASKYRIPVKFGNYSHSDLVSAPPCGTYLAEYNGIASYSNGEYQGTGYSCGDWTATGYQFQCVEYAQRYFNYLYGVQPVWPVNYASQMCYSYPAGMTTVYPPEPGDAVVWNWDEYGHVAVVLKVGDGVIDVIEENGSPYGTNTYYSSDVYCYLRFVGWTDAPESLVRKDLLGVE